MLLFTCCTLHPMESTDTLQRLRTLARNSRELEELLAETARLFNGCTDLVSHMAVVSDKVRRVFVLYSELLLLADIQ